MIITDYAKTALLQGLKAGLNKGSDNATLCFYDDMGGLLVKCPIDSNDGVISDNNLVYIPNGQTLVIKSGVITTATIFDDMGNSMIDGLTVATTNADVIVDKTSVQQGGYLVIESVIFQF